MKHTIAVIIPTLNEEVYLPSLLRSLMGQRYVSEIIVIDGGSMDNTRAVTDKFHVKWGVAAGGRAGQMNKGAAMANAEILLFLHADSLLPADCTIDIPPMLGRGYIAGTFRLRFDSSNLWLKIFAWFTRWNLGLFLYGDQGLFLKKETFNEIGGYENLAFMEDVSILRRLRRKGKLGKSRKYIVTSSRRFMVRGPVRQQLTNIWLVLLFNLGCKASTLKKWYPSN